MKTKVFAVYDSKVGAYLNPFHLRNGAEAIRGFETAANDPKTDIYAHSEDYTLFEIAEYDDETGQYNDYQVKTPLGNALTFRKDQTILKQLGN